MKERDLQSLLTKLLYAQCDITLAFELKVAKGNSLPFVNLQQHQENALRMAYEKKIVYKIVDCGFSNPFDGFVLAGVPAYVVICFYQPRQPKQFIFIEIPNWLKEKESSARKSLTKERAAEIASFVLS